MAKSLDIHEFVGKRFDYRSGSNKFTLTEEDGPSFAFYDIDGGMGRDMERCGYALVMPRLGDAWRPFVLKKAGEGSAKIVPPFDELDRRLERIFVLCNEDCSYSSLEYDAEKDALVVSLIDIVHDKLLRLRLDLYPGSGDGEWITSQDVENRETPLFDWNVDE